VTVAATAYAAIVGRHPAGIALVGGAVLLGQLSTGWQNDAIDASVDREAGRQEKPIVAGRVSRTAVGICALVAGLGCLVVSYGSGWRAGTVHTVAVVAAAAYNAGLKRTAFSILPYVVAFGLLPCFVTLGASGSPLPPWPIPTATAALGAAAHILNVLPDAEADRRTGIQSLPLRVPLLAAWLASAIALIASGALLALGGRPLSLPALMSFAGCAALGVGAVYFGARRSAWGFRLACLVAVADVILLGLRR
jgi:4-hydroxybenzoate polyprenyltransferase